MSSSLDLSLDDIIRKNQRFGGHKRNSGGKVWGPGPDRRPRSRHLSGPKPYPALSQSQEMRQQLLLQNQHLQQQRTMPSGGINRETGTKLYVSNLDSGVTSDDIMVLFSEVGELKKHSIHYDIRGRSKGTAEVVFHRHSDALAAIKRYNNVQLDGKPVKIELVGANLVAPDPVAPSKNRIMEKSVGGFRRLEIGQDRDGAKEWVRGGGRVSASGYTQGYRPGKKLSAADLDAELDRYHSEATRTKIIK